MELILKKGRVTRGDLKLDHNNEVKPPEKTEKDPLPNVLGVKKSRKPWKRKTLEQTNPNDPVQGRKKTKITLIIFC